MKVCPLLQYEGRMSSLVEGCIERVDVPKCWSVFLTVCTSPWLEVDSHASIRGQRKGSCSYWD